MRCVICDRCKKVIDNPRHCRVITCSRPLKLPIHNDRVPYHGNDKQQNDTIWEKELCTTCQDALDAFFEQGPGMDEPDSGETVTDPEDTDGEDEEQEP